MRPIAKTILLLLGSVCACHGQSHEYQFLRTYIATLGRQYRIEVSAQSELKEAGEDVVKMSMANMRSAKRSILELQAGMKSLDDFKRSRNNLVGEVSTMTIECYEYLIRNYGELIEQSELMMNTLSGSNPNPDVGKMMSKATDISTRHEYIMGTLSKSSQMLALSLLDTIPDVNGKLTYLLITSDERRELVSELDSAFGSSIRSVPKGATLSANATIAFILRSQLTGNRKSKNERRH